MTQNIIRFPYTSRKWTKRTQSNKWDENIFFVIYLFRKMIQYCISMSGKSMWISWISSSFRSEIRVHLRRDVFSQCNDYQISVRDLFIQKQESIKVWSESCHEKRKLLMTSEKEFMKQHQAIKCYKTISIEFGLHKSTNPQSDRVCTNGGNSRPLLPYREVVDQHRSLQSRMCNSLQGCKSSQDNF